MFRMLHKAGCAVFTVLVVHAHAFGVEEIRQAESEVGGLVEAFLNAPVNVEYEVARKTYYNPTDSSVEIVSTDGDTVEFEYRAPGAAMIISREDGSAQYPVLKGKIITNEDGTELLETGTLMHFRVLQLNENYIAERVAAGAGGVRDRLIKRGQDYRYISSAESTGQVILDQRGRAALMMAGGAPPFLPAAHARTIQQAYTRLPASGDQGEFSLRQDDDGTHFLEEKEAGEPVHRWEVLDGGILMRRQAGGPSMAVFHKYDGLQMFMGLPFPEKVEQRQRDRSETMTRTIIRNISISEADQAEIEAEIGTYFDADD